MVKELLKEHDVEEEKKEEEEDEDDKDVEKSVNSVLDQLQSIVDSQATLIETQKAIGESLVELLSLIHISEPTRRS